VWVKAKKTKLKDYEINVTTQREFADDETIMHMELQDNPEFFIAIREDLAVKLFLEEEMAELAQIDSIENLTKLEKKAMLEEKELELANVRIEKLITREDMIDKKVK